MDLQSLARKGLFNVPQTMTPSVSQPAGLVVPGNIDLGMQPRIPNEDGSISSVRSASFNDGPGREVLVPTVSADGRLLSLPEAVAQYKKTGKHLGIFKQPEHATAYGEQLHNDYAKGRIKGHGPAPEMSVGPFNVRGGNSLDFFWR